MAKHKEKATISQVLLFRPRVLDAIARMLARAGVSASEVSRRIGRSSGYMGSMVYNGTVPRTDLFVEIANACGYDVVIRGHGEEWSLVPAPGVVVFERKDGTVLHIEPNEGGKETPGNA